MADWNKIKADYIASATSYRKLAEKHGVSFNTLKSHAVDEGWYKLRQQKNEKATTKIIESASDKDAKKAVKIDVAADKLIEKAIELADIVGDAQSLKQLASALNDLAKLKGYKTEADIREQEARIDALKARAAASKPMDDEDEQGGVILLSDVDEYAEGTDGS